MTVPRWGLAAFLDESQSHRVLDPHTYLLAAAVCEPLAGDEVRDQLAALLLPHQVKLHWRDESDRRRRLLAATIAELPLRHLVVVREGRAGERAERRRRACLERMLYQPDRLYVTDATFESRGPADDQRDRDMVDTLRARRGISGRLRVHH